MLNLKKLLVISIGIACLWGILRPEIALLVGIFVSFLKGEAYDAHVKKRASVILKLSVVLLGAGVPFTLIVNTGLSSFGLTFVSILATIITGIYIAKIFRIRQIPAILISVGTAICGGSAIAAVAPTLNAGEQDLSLSLIIVFLLNAVGLFLFPFLGHFFQLDQTQFGLWAALAIHDTSSVVGAASIYGDQSLQIATLTKLVRALWILPVATITFMVFNKSADKKNADIPWFIFGFIAVAILFSYMSFLKPWAQDIYQFAKSMLVLSLFLIGYNSQIKSINRTQFKTIGMGVILWIIVSSFSLFYVLYCIEF